MTITILALGSNDSALLQSLQATFAEAFDDPGHYASACPRPAYLTRLLARDEFIALVALQAGTVIGGLVAYELHKFEQERSEMYIYDLAVASDHRRRGIATALIVRLQELAAARSAWVIYVQADRVDEPAIALYTKLGVREDVLHFDIAVAQAASGSG